MNEVLSTKNKEHLLKTKIIENVPDVFSPTTSESTEVGWGGPNP